MTTKLMPRVVQIAITDWDDGQQLAIYAVAEDGRVYRFNEQEDVWFRLPDKYVPTEPGDI